jgi:hypothetical protein
MHAQLKFRSSEGQNGEERFNAVDGTRQSLMERFRECRRKGCTIDESPRRPVFGALRERRRDRRLRSRVGLRRRSFNGRASTAGPTRRRVTSLRLAGVRRLV